MKQRVRFRWAVCQLDALTKCLNLRKLREAMADLPNTLDGTYDRILCAIDKEYSHDAFRILQWLVYSARPLRIEEVVDVIAVDINDDPRFDLDRRLPDPRDILTICSSLVTTTGDNRATFCNYGRRFCQTGALLRQRIPRVETDSRRTCSSIQHSRNTCQCVYS